MGIEPCLPRAPTVRVLTPAGQSDERNALAPGLRTNAPRDFVAIEFRHANIQQRYIREVPLSGLERKGPVGGTKHFVPPELQQRCETLQSVCIIVRHQDSS